MKEWGKACLCRLYYAYLRLLEKTVHLELELPENLKNGAVIGFWHKDSYIMNLLLKKMPGEQKISVIVTADERGDYIEYLLKRCHGEAIRLPDGNRCRTFMEDLTGAAKETKKILAVALDGPLGPRRIPKTLAFYLSETGKKDFIAVKADYSKSVSLSRRWDHYKIPLPFTSIKITMESYGVTGRKNIPRLDIGRMEASKAS